MDDFLTADEAAFRRRAADRLRSAALAAGAAIPEVLEKIWSDLGAPGGSDAAPGPFPIGPAGRVAVIEAAAARDPRLGLVLLNWASASGRLDPREETLCRCGRLAGTAARVLEDGTAAARAGGAFASSLLSCRDTQETLAGLACGAALLRLATLRVCRLLERGEEAAAAAESARLRSRARGFARDVRAAALALLGTPWVEANLPADDPASDDERKEP